MAQINSIQLLSCENGNTFKSSSVIYELSGMVFKVEGSQPSRDGDYAYLVVTPSPLGRAKSLGKMM